MILTQLHMTQEPVGGIIGLFADLGWSGSLVLANSHLFIVQDVALGVDARRQL